MRYDVTTVSSTPIGVPKETNPVSVENRCLPTTAWPEQDRVAWEAGTRRADLFEPKGAGANWSLQSQKKTARGYGRWLYYLGRKGVLEPTIAPGSRVTRALVADYVQILSASCAPYTVICRLQELYDALRVLGQKWIGGGSRSFGCDSVVVPNLP